ncbi:MAG: LamG-like jellyroll fold domain-containing protein [Patescibacteria group bacterium]
MYVNGQVLVNTTYTPNLGSAVKRIGRIGTDSTYDFNGSIDEARIYNRALSATEILNMYNDLK